MARGRKPARLRVGPGVTGHRKVVHLDVLRAKQERGPDVTFTVDFYILKGRRLWHEPYELMFRNLTHQRSDMSLPRLYRTIAHALAEDANVLWDEGGAGRPRPAKKVKTRKRRRGWR